jgi:hypothetical protein
MVASEWYMRNQHFPGWGRPYEFASELFKKVRWAGMQRAAVAAAVAQLAPAASPCIRVPVGTLLALMHALQQHAVRQFEWSLFKRALQRCQHFVVGQFAVSTALNPEP